MRSYILDGIPTHEIAIQGLAHSFPDQEDFETKVVFGPDGKQSISWLYVGEPDDFEGLDGPFLIQADLSGRFYDFDINTIVIQTLRIIQAQIGGVIRNDDGIVV